VHVVEPEHLPGPPVGDARLALDLEVARLQLLAEREGDGKLCVDLAVGAGERHPGVVQQPPGFLVEHLQRQRQRPLAARRDRPVPRQRLVEVDRECALEGKAAPVGRGEARLGRGNLQRLAFDPQQRAGNVQRRPAVEQVEGDVAALECQRHPIAAARGPSGRGGGGPPHARLRSPRTRWRETQLRVCGASAPGHSVLNRPADIGPSLPSSLAFMAPPMSATSPWIDTSVPPACKVNWLSTTRPRSGARKPRANQSSIASRSSAGGSAANQPPADLTSNTQPGPSAPCAVWAMLPVNCTRLSPHSSTEGAISKRRVVLL
jgi:hypothetical protein